MFFDTWQGLGRVIVVDVLAYASLVVFHRFSGKRALSKINAFDLVITVSLASILATIILSKDVALDERYGNYLRRKSENVKISRNAVGA